MWVTLLLHHNKILLCIELPRKVVLQVGNTAYVFVWFILPWFMSITNIIELMLNKFLFLFGKISTYSGNDDFVIKIQPKTYSWWHCISKGSLVKNIWGMYENALSEPGNSKKIWCWRKWKSRALEKSIFFCKLYYSYHHHYSILFIFFFFFKLLFLLDAIIMHLAKSSMQEEGKLLVFHFISDSNVLENYTRPNCSLRVPTSFQGEELSCNTTM